MRIFSSTHSRSFCLPLVRSCSLYTWQIAALWFSSWLTLSSVFLNLFCKYSYKRKVFFSLQFIKRLPRPISLLLHTCINHASALEDHCINISADSTRSVFPFNHTPNCFSIFTTSTCCTVTFLKAYDWQVSSVSVLH